MSMGERYKKHLDVIEGLGLLVFATGTLLAVTSGGGQDLGNDLFIMLAGGAVTGFAEQQRIHQGLYGRGPIGALRRHIGRSSRIR